MLVQTTLDTLNRLKLYGMAAALAEQLNNSAAASLWFEERLGRLVDREVLHRDNRRLTRLLQLAQLKHRNDCVGDIDYHASRRLDRSQITSLATCDWIRLGAQSSHPGCNRRAENLAGLRLCPAGVPPGLVRPLYIRAPRLFDELSVGHADGSFRKRLTAIAKVNVIVIDDFAIAPMGARERTDLLEILDDRVGTRSTIVTSQLNPDDWHDYIGEPTLADAILDRLMHSAHKIHLEARESMRKSGTRSKPARHHEEQS